jgi:sulfite reductase alpha subunit-like flavoprotein
MIVTSSSEEDLFTNQEMDSEQREPTLPYERKPSLSLKGPSKYPEVIDLITPPPDILPIPSGIDMKLIKNTRITSQDHWQDVRKLTFLMRKRYCCRPGREVSNLTEAYHEKIYDCANRCGPNCRGRCSMCRGECSGECRECDESYHPGDIVTIFPKNFPEDVDEIINIMGWQGIADKEVALESTKAGYFDHDNTTSTSNVPNLYRFEKTTFRDLLIHNLDITAIPNRIFFTFIAAYSNDPTHKERLLEFGNPAHRDEYFDYATRPRRSILEVLQDFSSSVKIPWEEATNIFPVIRGRQFSIASGGFLKDCPSTGMVKIELVIALVKYRTVLKKVRQGLCSRYIASLSENTIIRVRLETNKKFDIMARQQPELPIIMIAPGTGIAPCRSLIWERSRERAKNADDFAEHVQKRNLIKDTKVIDMVYEADRKKGLINLPSVEHDDVASGEQVYGETVLFFGNRNKDADYLFQDEWKHAELRLKVFTAFSRDQRQKIYIQDVIRKEGRLIVSLLRKGAIVYVCGSSGNMPKAVKAALLDVIETENSMTEDEAAGWLQKIEKAGAYIQETW